MASSCFVYATSRTDKNFRADDDLSDGPGFGNAYIALQHI